MYIQLATYGTYCPRLETGSTNSSLPPPPLLPLFFPSSFAGKKKEGEIETAKEMEGRKEESLTTLLFLIFPLLVTVPWNRFADPHSVDPFVCRFTRCFVDSFSYVHFAINAFHFLP